MLVCVYWTTLELATFLLKNYQWDWKRKVMTSVYLTALSISRFLQSFLTHSTRPRLLCFRVKNICRFRSEHLLPLFRT